MELPPLIDPSRVKHAVTLAEMCLEDDEPWTPEELVEQIERIYEALGGDVSALTGAPDGKEKP